MVTVTVEESRPLRVPVLGEVARPGVHESRTRKRCAACARSGRRADPVRRSRPHLRPATYPKVASPSPHPLQLRSPRQRERSFHRFSILPGGNSSSWNSHDGGRLRAHRRLPGRRRARGISGGGRRTGRRAQHRDRVLIVRWTWNWSRESQSAPTRRIAIYNWYLPTTRCSCNPRPPGDRPAAAPRHVPCGGPGQQGVALHDPPSTVPTARAIRCLPCGLARWGSQHRPPMFR